MTGVLIGEEERRAIYAHGEQAYPRECCGMLLGKMHDKLKVVEAVKPLDNASTDASEKRFLIPPHEVLQGEREARKSGLEIIGFYHSHPDAAASPSEYDLENAWPWLSYVIVSVRQAQAGELRSWTLRDDRSRFDPEEILSKMQGENDGS
jgi:proteasome lid subunit RPN8/RPN11